MWDWVEICLIVVCIFFFLEGDPESMDASHESAILRQKIHEKSWENEGK